MKSGLIASPLDRSICRMLYRQLSDVVFFIRIPIWWKRPRLSDFLPAVRPEMPASWSPSRGELATLEGPETLDQVVVFNANLHPNEMELCVTLRVCMRRESEGAHENRTGRSADRERSSSTLRRHGADRFLLDGRTCRAWPRCDA